MNPPFPPNAPQTGWEVISQTEQQVTGPTGLLELGWHVIFKTGKGVVGSVDIPASRYNPANVRAEIAARAAQIDQVQGMTG